MRSRANEWSREKYRTDAAYRLGRLMRVGVRRGVTNRNQSSSTFDLLGYTAADLESRLKATIPSGFRWDDFLSGKLHIDHIRPLSSFKIRAAGDSEFMKCWALSNLQLLPAAENKLKKNRMPIEPSVKGC